MVNSRNKGAAFEREVAALISEATGLEVRRNLTQYQKDGEADLLGVDGWAVECKIRKEGYWPEDQWWDQVERAAKASNTKPALIYRFNRQPPRVMVRTKYHDLWIRVVMSMEDWLKILRKDHGLLTSITVTGPDESATSQD